MTRINIALLSGGPSLVRLETDSVDERGMLRCSGDVAPTKFQDTGFVEILILLRRQRCSGLYHGGARSVPIERQQGPGACHRW